MAPDAATDGVPYQVSHAVDDADKLRVDDLAHLSGVFECGTKQPSFDVAKFAQCAIPLGAFP